MVPALTTGGRSFKGAAAYYLHDKRREGEAERSTADRVAWTHVINLPTTDPERAWRMMATTALKAEELKAAAGVKATGRKLAKPVFAYSLAWHPSEQPTQAEQLDAARETLKLLGLSEHQALIVCHNDEPHPHVHVLVNRVHPTEGKAATLSNSKLTLSKWAQAYEQDRGKVFCPARVDNNAKREQGKFARDSRKSRPAYEFAQLSEKGGLRGAFVASEQRQQDAQLAQAGRDMQENHGKQWDELRRAYQTAKDRLYARADKRQSERAAEVKQEFKPEWASLFQKQRSERREFENRESTPFGKLWNIAATAREARHNEDVRAAGPLGFLFAVLSGSERENLVALRQDGERVAMAGRLSKVMQRERSAIRQQTKAEADALRESYLNQCAELRRQQGQAREAMRDRWRQRNTERKAVFAALPSRAANMNRLRQHSQAAAQHRGRMGRSRGREMEP